MAEPERSVLQVITSTDRRGAEMFAVELDGALGELGWDVRTVALAPGHSEPTLDVPVLGRQPLALSTLRALRRDMRDVDVTIAHGSRTLPATALAALSTPARVVYRNIGDPRFWAATPLRRARAGWAARRAAAVVALSEGAARVIEERFRVPGQRIVVIPQAAAITRFQPATHEQRLAARKALNLPEDSPVVAFLGGLLPEKDPALAIAAVSQLDDTHLVIAGAGTERPDALEAIAADTSDRVHLAGMLPDPTDCYAAADVVLVTSRSEGMPAVLVEAGLSAIPVVTTEVGFVRDVVVHGATGFVVPTRNPADLAHALRTALAERTRLGPVARRRCVQGFALDAATRRWDALLARLARA